MAVRPHSIAPPPTRPRGRRDAYDLIVVGTGVGGAVTAGIAAHRGARVLVIEKNRKVGGILASYERDGFKVDVGSHLISRGARGPLARALREAGLSGPRFLTHPIPVRSRGVFEVTAPADRAGLLPVGLEVARGLGLPLRERMSLARLFFQVFTLTELELRRWDRRTLDAFIRQHTEHPAVYFLVAFLASIFFVLPPWQVSAGESIRALRSVLWAYSLSYVEGGMDSIPHALLGRVSATGGDVLVGQRVVSIRRRGTGLRVTTADGDAYDAPDVACNLAPEDLLALLEDAVPPAYAARVEAIEPSGNAHQIKLFLRHRLLDEGCMIGGASHRGIGLGDLSIELMQGVVRDIEMGRVPDPIPIYAPIPTNYDPTLAPEGHQLVTASVYGPSVHAPLDPPEVWRERTLQALARMIPGLEDALLFAEFTPIPAVGRWMGKSRNAAIANGQWPGQVGRDRLQVETPVPGLYLCGDGAGGRGIGTEMAAVSAMETVAAIERARTSRLRGGQPSRDVEATLPSLEPGRAA